MDRFQRRHCGGAPLTEGCINIASVTDVAEQCAMALIVRLEGFFAPHQALGPEVGVLHHLRNGHFFKFSHFCFDGMVSQLNRV